jgi:TPR repeat protein
LSGQTESPNSEADHDFFALDELSQRLWDDGIALMKEGRYETALAIFLRLAEGDVVKAMPLVASIYDRGPGNVKEDLALAEYWLDRTHAQVDEPHIDFDLARIILKRHIRDTGSVDNARVDFAVDLLEHLAERNDPYGILYLAAIYGPGGIRPQDDEKAALLYRRAAEQGFVIALIELSKIAWRQRRYLHAIGLRLKGIFWMLKLIGNLKDRRMFMMHHGYKMNEEFPGWYRPDGWPMFE